MIGFTVVIMLCAIISVYAVGLWCLRRNGKVLHSINRLGSSTLVVSSSALAASASSLYLPYSLSLAATTVFLFLMCVCEGADVVSFRYFGNSIAQNYAHLPFSLRSRNADKALIAYFYQYFPHRHGLIVFGILIGSILLATLIAPPGRSSVCCAFVGILTGALLSNASSRSNDQTGLSSIEKAFLLADEECRFGPLFRAPRSGSFVLTAEPPNLPPTILIIINESVGANIPSSDGTELLLSDRIRELSGNFQEWFEPSNAVTNSSCTELHQMPFLFDLAKSRGYRTAFFSSSTMAWANFDVFFEGAPIDEICTAESFGLPFINDVTVDDYVPVRKLASRLENINERFFAVLYCNALHVPFQSTSICDIPSAIVERRARAAYLVEQEYRLLFNTLRAANRYNDALIISVGDHGEIIGNSGATFESRMARTTELHDSVIRPLFLLKPPKGLTADMCHSLTQNVKALVTNVDIAPSIAQLLGISLTGELSYVGYSLFNKIPDGRIAYLLNLNEWRSWSRGAVGIFRGNSSVMVDYLDERPCRYNCGADVGSQQERDELLAMAYREDIVRASISHIYKERIGNKISAR